MAVVAIGLVFGMTAAAERGAKARCVARDVQFGMEDEHDIKKIRELYTRLSDSAKLFCFERLEVSPVSNAPKAELWSNYLSFCSTQRLPAISEKAFWTSFAHYFEGMAFEKRPVIDGEQVRVMAGIRMKFPEEYAKK